MKRPIDWPTAAPLLLFIEAVVFLLLPLLALLELLSIAVIVLGSFELLLLFLSLIILII